MPLTKISQKNIQDKKFYIVCYFSFKIQKDERRSLYAVRETEFLRLKRTRIGRDDFESLKVIGKGAFGEVSV